MKKLILFLVFFAATSLTLEAQKNCSKADKAKCAAMCLKAKTAKSAAVKASLVEAIVVAESDNSIEKNVCSKSGLVSFSKKGICPHSGKVTFQEVEYDSENKSFVNVSPSDVYNSAEGKPAINASMESKSGTKVKACKSKASSKSCAGKKASKAEKT